MRRLFARLTTTAIVALALASGAAAAEYPNRPVRLIVPFPPGGSNDVVGRLVAEQLSAQLGQQVFVDNRGSAGGIVGTEMAAGAAPDGYTLLVISIPFVVDPALHKLNFDPIKSFEPVALLATGPDVLVVNPAVPVKSVKDLVELAKAKPGQLNYASAGIGTFTHLAGALFTQLAGVKIVHVPYRGGGPAIQDVLADHVGIMFSSLIQTAPFIKNGQLRPLGTGGTQRSPALPDVPTIAEAGVPGYAAANWWGILAPAGTPPVITEKIHDAIETALKSPELQKEFEREGATTAAKSSAEFGDFIKSEIAKWSRVVKEDNIQAQ
jgi:tripartite-type tricarboxylate transporter receptor subunit TctC